MVAAYYRFFNSTSVHVRVIWLQSKSRRLAYGILPPKTFVDVNTFETHSWIFEDVKTGDYICADLQCIFITQSWIDIAKECFKLKGKPITPHMKIYPVRKTIKLTKPLLSLKIMSLLATRNTGISIEQADKLELPKTLIELLKIAISRKECLAKHTQICTKCPFDVHKAHFHDICVFPSNMKS